MEGTPNDNTPLPDNRTAKEPKESTSLRSSATDIKPTQDMSSDNKDLGRLMEDDASSVEGVASSIKESSPSVRSLRSNKSSHSAKSPQKHSRKIKINMSETSNINADTYTKKVEFLRKDLEQVLSRWVMSARDNVDQKFYGTIRQSFEMFMQEIEFYQNVTSPERRTTLSDHAQGGFQCTTPCPVQDEKPSAYAKYLLENAKNRKREVPEESDQFSLKPRTAQTSKKCLVSAIQLAERINQRLNHLINLLAQCKNKLQPHIYKDELSKPRRCYEKRHYDKQASCPEATEQLITYLENKLRKYKEKYGTLQTRDFKKPHSYEPKSLYSKNLEREVESKKKQRNMGEPRKDDVRVSVWMRTIPRNTTQSSTPLVEHRWRNKLDKQTESRSP